MNTHNCSLVECGEPASNTETGPLVVTFKKIKINCVDVGERGRGGLVDGGETAGGKWRLEKGKRKEQRVE